MRAAFVKAGACVLAAALPAYAQRGPAPAPSGLPADVLSLACAPTLAYRVPDVKLRISGGQDTAFRVSHAPGDLVTINAGTRDGIAVGQEFYTRRPLAGSYERVSQANPATIRTTGWVRVWAVEDDMSLATITHACETVDVDSLDDRAVTVRDRDSMTQERIPVDGVTKLILARLEAARAG